MEEAIVPANWKIINMLSKADIRLRRSGLCSIRDVAYSRFDRSTSWKISRTLKVSMGFLSKYVDETAVYRRRSQSENDNPPSPITMEDSHGRPASVGLTILGGGSMRCLQSPRDPGLRFVAPLTPPSGRFQLARIAGNAATITTTWPKSGPRGADSTLLAFCQLQLQVNYIHQLIQGRIVDSPDALAEVYKCLKYSPQSLQIDVLYTQTRDHLDDHIHVDEYIPGTKLTVSTCPNTSTVR
ncbi:hypothetical protein quinque_014500 [Culex quinquefasciatus]